MFAQPVNEKFDKLGINLQVDAYFNGLKWYHDMAKTTSFFRNNTTGGTIDASTGYPISGATSHAINFAGGAKFEEGTYTFNNTGGGSIPSPHVVTNGQGTVNFNFTGNQAGFSFIKNGETGTYTDTFMQRCRAAGVLRFMQPLRINDSNFDQANPETSIQVGASNSFYHRVPSPQDAVDICNEFNCALWWNFDTESDATYWNSVIPVLDGCNQDVILEYGNETWNASLPSYQNLKNDPDLALYAPAGEFSSVNALAMDRTNAIGAIGHAIDANKFLAVFNGQFRQLFSVNAAITNNISGMGDVDGVALGFYCSGPDFRALTPAQVLALSYDEALAIMDNDFENYMKGQLELWLNITDAQGWRLMCYEGPSLHSEQGDNSSADDYLVEIGATPEAGIIQQKMIRYWRDRVNDYACCYRDGSSANLPPDIWGLMPRELDPGLPRFTAWKRCAPYPGSNGIATPY